MRSYVEDRVESLEHALLWLLIGLVDYKCPSCGSKELLVSWGEQPGLLCMGKDCSNTYEIGQIAEGITSINKSITFHPTKVY